MATLEERFSMALHNAARGWRHALDRRLKDLGMSQASWLTVAEVAKAREPLSQIELAQRVGVEGATMVVMIDRLAKSGLVVRVPSLTDRRVKRVQLTPAGEALFAQVRVEAAAVRREFLRHADGSALKQATEFLEHLLGVIEADRP